VTSHFFILENISDVSLQGDGLSERGIEEASFVTSCTICSKSLG
jgi:hypothetical protein